MTEAPAPPMTLADAKASLGAPLPSGPAVVTPSPEAAPAGQPETQPSSLEGASPEAGTQLMEPAVPDPQSPSTPAELNQETAGEGQPVESTSEASAGDTPLPEGWQMLEVPDGHFYRDRGHTQIPVPPGLENEYRAFLNEPTRRAEVAEAAQARDNAAAEATRWQTIAEFYIERSMTLARDPQVAATVAQITESMGAEAAERYVDGLFAADEAELKDRLSKAQEASQTAQLERESNAIIAGANRVLQGRFPEMGQSQRNQLIAGFASRMEAGMANPTRTDLERYIDEVVGPKQPSAPQPSMEELKEQIRAELQAEAEAAQQAHLATRSVNPMGGVPSAVPVAPGRVDTTQVQNIRDVRRAL